MYHKIVKSLLVCLRKGYGYSLRSRYAVKDCGFAALGLFLGHSTGVFAGFEVPIGIWLKCFIRALAEQSCFE
jgi:hypothetical protein